MLPLGLCPWRSWRAPQMRSPVQPRPSCHAPHSGYGHRGLVVVTENSAWDGKNSRCQIGNESLMFMATVVILLRRDRGIDGGRAGSRVCADGVVEGGGILGIFIGFQTSRMICEESCEFRIEV